MMNKRLRTGLTLIELMVIVAMVAILAKIAIASYQAYILRANRELARQAMLQNLSLLEKFYSQNGQYVESNLAWPNSIVSVVGVGGRPVYSISFYPSQATSNNKQSFCMVATPVSGTIQASDGTIYVDRFGNFSSTIPANCSSANNTLCSNNSTSYPPCYGNCANGVYSACSGNCDSVTVCAGGDGCSGNCRNSVIYGPCSGNCFDSVIIWNGSCGGNCKRSTCCNLNTGVCNPCP